jgi:hypothetical protein
LGRLEQDRIVTLYTVVEDDMRLALVLRFIDGNSLADRIDAEGALPLNFLAASVRDIVPALGFAHERGIIHRDIKPQNVLVDRQGRSFLTDFGIAVADFAERGTVTGFSVGTPHYMSPEQIQTPRAITIQNRGHRSDIYSYGVVLYEMLTGRVPFGGDSGAEEIYKVQHAHCVEAPPAPRQVNPSVPKALEELVLRCLEKDPDRRPQTCAELLQEFNTAMDGKPALKRPAAHAATVIEPREGKRVEAKAAPKQEAPAPVPAAPGRSGGLPKGAWLGVGALLIAGGIGYAVYSSKTQPPATLSSLSCLAAQLGPGGSNTCTVTLSKTGGGIVKLASDNPALTVPPSVAVDTASTTATFTAKAGRFTTNSSAIITAVTSTATQTANISLVAPPQSQTPPPKPEGPSLTGKKEQNKKEDRPSEPPPTEIKPAATNPVAEGDYSAAAEMLQKGQPCEADDTVKQAMQLDRSNQKYLVLQTQAARACGAILYAKAKDDFAQGNYCPGKSAIDAAIRRVPTNTSYIELQKSLATGCKIQ